MSKKQEQASTPWKELMSDEGLILILFHVCQHKIKFGDTQIGIMCYQLTQLRGENFHFEKFNSKKLVCHETVGIWKISLKIK